MWWRFRRMRRGKMDKAPYICYIRTCPASLSSVPTPRHRTTMVPCDDGGVESPKAAGPLLTLTARNQRHSPSLTQRKLCGGRCEKGDGRALVVVVRVRGKTPPVFAESWRRRGIGGATIYRSAKCIARTAGGSSPSTPSPVLLAGGAGGCGPPHFILAAGRAMSGSGAPAIPSVVMLWP